jgi:hypothetical protein
MVFDGGDETDQTSVARCPGSTGGYCPLIFRLLPSMAQAQHRATYVTSTYRVLKVFWFRINTSGEKFKRP